MDVKTLRKLSNTPSEKNKSIMRLAAADAKLFKHSRTFREMRRKSSLLIEWASNKDNRMKIDRVSYALDTVEDEDDEFSEKSEQANRSIWCC